MTRSPMFSVVIPTHDSRDFVVAAIHSVLGQTDHDFEIIVIDNGSKDDTAEAVTAIGDSRISYTWQEDSGLPADSRNKGVAAAAGEWVAFLDADDAWHPEKLARVRSTAASDSAIAVIGHDVDIVDLKGSNRGSRAYRLDERPVWEQLLYRGNFFTTSAMTVRTAALRAAGGFDTRSEYFMVEDYDLWLRLAAAGSHFVIIPETLGSYLVHPGGASSRLVRHYDALMRLYDDHAIAAARAGCLDVRAAVARRRRSRLAEVRDLVRGGKPGAAVRVLMALASECSTARAVYGAAAARSLAGTDLREQRP